MSISNEKLSTAVQQLHRYLLQHHWHGNALSGPDSGVRWNFKLGRFVKSYLNFVPWRDNYTFMQTQGYWIMSNWLMAELWGDDQYRNLAMDCSNYLVAAQQPAGHWVYPPLPSRIGKIATVEGNIATIGLLASYRQTHDPALVNAATRWHEFLENKIGFQERNGLLAINYWANEQNGAVPNNTTLTLWTLAELTAATHDARYMAPSAAMMAFLQRAQMASGELPYEIGHTEAEHRPHFLCFQYNAFEFLDLTRYYQLTADKQVLPVLQKLARFLATGLTADGAARYNCHQVAPETIYYTAAVATALSQATALGLGDYRALAEQGYNWVLAQQKANGSMAFFSRGNYGLLTDRRAYPRNLSMILYHLLRELQTRRQVAPANLQAEPKARSSAVIPMRIVELQPAVAYETTTLTHF